MTQNILKIMSIDTDNILYTCDDSHEYSLMNGIENIVIGILKQLTNDNG